MPCLGDFASRRLTTEFIGLWDPWLQRSLAVSRQQLGDAWLDMFLTSPMWRFALAQGTCGEHAWAGLLVPSVDKVGRYFPLTIALRIEPGGADIISIFGAQAWYASLESIGLSALKLEYSPHELDEALAALTFPCPSVTGDHAGVGQLMESVVTASAPMVLHFASVESIAAATLESARAAYATKMYGRTFWWSVAQDSGTTEFHCSVGLPPPNHFSIFLGSNVPAAPSAAPLTVPGTAQRINAADTPR